MSATDSAARLHALDNLRAAMMWLGIVIHVAVNHVTTPAVPWKDAQLTPMADLLLLFIHAFRMPAFFILAGFLAALMVDARGPAAMLRNRVRRLALPFAVFWPILFGLTLVLVLMFAHLMARGTIGLDPAVVPRVPGGQRFPTMHLWFIYYLFWFCLVAAGLCAMERFIPAGLKQLWTRAWQALAAHWWGVPILALPLAWAGAGYPAGILAVDTSFMLNPHEVVQNGVFFLLGWTLFALREMRFPALSRYYWAYLVAGALCFIVTLALLDSFAQHPGTVANIELKVAYAYGLTSCCWSLGLLGLFLRWLPRQHRVLRYLSDSSYWVFMVHMLGTIGFGVLLYNAPWGAGAKMAVNMAATTIVCLLSYHWLVRGSWIGVLLNGRRHRA